MTVTIHDHDNATLACQIVVVSAVKHEIGIFHIVLISAGLHFKWFEHALMLIQSTYFLKNFIWRFSERNNSQLLQQPVCFSQLGRAFSVSLAKDLNGPKSSQSGHCSFLKIKYETREEQ